MKRHSCGARNHTKDIRQAIKVSEEKGNAYRAKLKWAKIDVLSTIMWMRTTCPQATERMATRPKEVRMYHSRMVECGVCMHPKETKHMQRRSRQGYRSITCPKCHSHARVERAHCQCGIIWHQCMLHRIDPTVHKSTKPQTRTLVEEKGVGKQFDSRREAPDVKDSTRKFKREKSSE